MGHQIIQVIYFESYVISTFKLLTTLFSCHSLFDNELVFVDRLIGADLRNNSAWNQRYFVLNHTGFTPEVIQYELNYVMNRIGLVKNNESTWNYLRGLLQHGTGKLDQHPEVSSVIGRNGLRFIQKIDRQFIIQKTRIPRRVKRVRSTDIIFCRRGKPSFYCHKTVEFFMQEIKISIIT